MTHEMEDRKIRGEQLAAWAVDRSIECRKAKGNVGTILEDAKAIVDFVMSYEPPVNDCVDPEEGDVTDEVIQ